MKAVIFVTVMFWGENTKPLELEFITNATECSKELNKRYTEPLRVLEDWKIIISTCEEKSYEI
jgi:hypothetical protein